MPNFFINMIRMLLCDASTSVNISKPVTKPFRLQKGVHQGCPLAPYLFVIVANALHDVIKNVVKIGLIKGIYLPQCLTQQIIYQYANNTSFTMRAEEASMDNLVGIIQNFGFASSLEINQHKNMVCWCGYGLNLFGQRNINENGLPPKICPSFLTLFWLESRATRC